MLPRDPLPRPPAWRILIAGGGPLGLSLACALSQGLGPAVSVTVLDPTLSGKRGDARAYSLSPAAVTMLHVVGIWPGLVARAEPVRGMTITDSRVEDAVRPAYLRFGDGEQPLAHLIEADHLDGALRAACEKLGVALVADRATAFDVQPAAIVARTEAGNEYRASLLVACDGARSTLREAAGIGWVGRHYGQSGIVATVAHELPHGGVAIQHFLPAGPFAILPLPGTADHPHRSSIVWTEESRRAASLLQLGRDDVVREVQARFGTELGSVDLLSGLHAFPLSVGLARSYVGSRLSLVGDAAHRVHPLAGQGLNLGLGDVAALAERIADAVRLGLDPGSETVLDGYQRDRRVDALAMAGATDALNRLFSNDRLPTRVLRDLGLGLVDRAPRIKGFFSTQAAGVSDRAPRLLRGEAL